MIFSISHTFVGFFIRKLGFCVLFLIKFGRSAENPIQLEISFSSFFLCFVTNVGRWGTFFGGWVVERER